jgi:HEAT repeat protein
MTGKQALTALAVTLLVATIFVMGYQFGRGGGDATRETIQREVGEQLASLDEIRERLRLLEEEATVRNGAADESPGQGGEEEAAGAEERWTALQEGLSALQLRVDGLEQDPAQRGFSYVESKNAELRREGVNILTRVARFDPEARAALRALLRDPSARVREQAAQKLRDLRDKESAPEMVRLLGDPDSSTRRRAVQALGAMEASDAASAIGESLTSDADGRVRETAADVLGKLNSLEATEFLVAALKDPSDAVRGQAIASLGEIRATSAAPQMRALYEENPGPHRLRLVVALKTLGDEVPLQKEVARLTELVKSGESDGVRGQAIKELSYLARDSSQAVFTQALEDPSPRVRREAERALR